MFTSSDVNLIISGTFSILALLNFLFSAWSSIRLKYLSSIRSRNFIICFLYILLLLYNGIRFICFLLSIFYVNNHSENANDVEFYRKILFLLLYGPEMIIWIILFVFFWAFLDLLYSSHLDLRLEQIKKAQTKWNTNLICLFIIATFVVTKISMIYFYFQEEIGENKYIIGTSILFLCLVFVILIREIFIHRILSGLPYKSVKCKENKRNINIKIMIWIITRVFHCLLIMVLLVSNNLASYIKEIALNNNDLTDYEYYMILYSVIIIFLDRLLFELIPISLILDLSTFNIFINSQSESPLLLDENSEEEQEIRNYKDNKSSLAISSEQDLQKFFISDFKIDLNDVDYRNTFGRLIFTQLNKVNEITFDSSDQNIQTNEKTCIRIFKFSKMSHFLKESVLNDMNKHLILQRQEDLNIANFKGFFKEDEYFSLVYEFYTYGYY